MGMYAVREPIDYQDKDWRGLRKMDLSQCKMTMSDLKSLSSKQWPNLRTLIIFNTFIDHAMLAELLKNEWPALRCFDLGTCPLWWIGCNQLGSQGMETLLMDGQILFLEEINLGNLILANFSQWPYWRLRAEKNAANIEQCPHQINSW